MKKHWIVLFILVVILGTLAYLSTWTVDKVQVEGCEIVNTQSVSDAMKEEAPLDNTLLLYIKSKMNKLKDLSFVSKMDLELTDKNTVTVTVYEKSIAGCVLYKGDYVYFDKDGIVLDSSKRRVGSAPLIKGLTFTEWSIGKKLPSDDDKKFQTILTITQLVEKYDLEIDGIKFTAENEIVLQHGGITIELGEGEYLAVQMMNLRMGHGYDVQLLSVGRSLILGGVHVPYDRGLDGHSAADVLPHAVMDALLGAAALGDIGRLFPDSDDAFLNISSLVLLSRVRDALADAGNRVVNIDATLIAQAPKVGPYRRQMQENLAAALGDDPGCVNVKATTEELLCFSGDGSGMSAHAVALIEHL